MKPPFFFNIQVLYLEMFLQSSPNNQNVTVVVDILFLSFGYFVSLEISQGSPSRPKCLAQCEAAGRGGEAVRTASLVHRRDERGSGAS